MERRSLAAIKEAELDVLRPHIESIAASLETCRRKANTSSARLMRSTDPRAATYRHLMEDVEEIAYLLKIARRVLRSDASLAPTFREITQRGGSHTYAPTSPEAMVFAQHRENLAEVVVLTKALHEWINHIHITLDQDQAFERALDADLKRRIARIVLVREKLIAHKAEMRNLISGTMHFENLATTTFNRIHFGLPEVVAQEINATFAKYSDLLPNSIRSEQNVHEQFAALVEHHTSLPGNVRGRLRTLVEEHGGESASLATIATLVEAFATGVLVPLAEEVSSEAAE